MSGSCCNGTCRPNECNCYASNPNWKPDKYGLIKSLIKTGLQLYDDDSIKSKNHGKYCLVRALECLNELKE